ncbi:MAG: formate dehydrogenase subunit gamma [Pseudomonadota bacterium]|jgi:formate dehydrogenase subunit gamma
MMPQDLVKRYPPSERFVHWVHMVTFILLSVTGLGLYAKSFFGLTGLFGGVDTSRAIHHWLGVLFTITTVVIFAQWKKDITAPGDDTVMTVIKEYMNPKLLAAPSGKFNASQKMVGWAALVLGLVMAGTGFAMWFPFALARVFQQWMYFFHNLGFIIFAGVILIHAYLGIWGAPGTWRAMTRGTVTKAWAEKHHPKWEGEEV